MASPHIQDGALPGALAGCVLGTTLELELAMEKEVVVTCAPGNVASRGLLRPVVGGPPPAFYEVLLTAPLPEHPVLDGHEGDGGLQSTRLEGCCGLSYQMMMGIQKERAWICIHFASHLHRTTACQAHPSCSSSCGDNGGGCGEERGVQPEEDGVLAWGCSGRTGCPEAQHSPEDLPVARSSSFSGGSFSLLSQELTVLRKWPLWLNVCLGHLVSAAVHCTGVLSALEKWGKHCPGFE